MSDYPLLAVRILVAFLLSYSLWRLMRRLLRSNDRQAGILVAAGFLLRAFAGQALFWISYLGLPVGRRLQYGKGIWFFALDSWSYLTDAQTIARLGFRTIFSLPRGPLPSPFYYQVLSFVIKVAGEGAAAGLLLNLICYALTCTLLIAWASGIGAEARAPLLGALATLSLFPSLVLWSLQPLKEALFILLVVCYTAAVGGWARSWLTPSSWRNATLSALAMWLALYGLAGTRNYFGLLTWAVSAVVLVAISLRALRGRRLACAAASLFLFLSLSRAVLWGAGPTSLPAAMWIVNFQLPDPSSRVGAGFRRVGGLQWLMAVLYAGRAGFDRTGGTTRVTAFPSARATAPSETTQFPNESAAGRGQESPGRRVVTGLASLALPRAVGQRLHLFWVSGGQGLWAFADADTLCFDLLICWVSVSLWKGPGFRTLARPAALLIVLTTAATTIMLAYVVTNFGTLFRLREMVIVGLLLLPLAATQEEKYSKTP